MELENFNLRAGDGLLSGAQHIFDGDAWNFFGVLEG